MTAQVEPLYARERAEPTPLKHIRRLALPFEVGFAVLTCLGAVLLMLVLILAYVPGDYVTFNADGGWLTMDPATVPADAVSASSLPIATQILGLCAGLLIQGAMIFSLWCLYKLFGLYRRGQVFAERPVMFMRRAGIGLVVFAVSPGLLQPFLRMLGSPDRNWFHSETVPILLIGAGLFVFSYIIALGRELERENKGFI